MSTCQHRIIFIIVLTSLILVLIMPSTGEEKEPAKKVEADIVLNEKNPELTKELLVGDTKEPIVNPKSVSLARLLDNNEYQKEARKSAKENMPGRFSIYQTKASDQILRLIVDYAKANEVKFIIKEEFLFKLLREKPEFKEKTDEELRKQFDITDDIIAYDKKKKEEEKKAENKEKRNEEPIRVLLEELFSD